MKPDFQCFLRRLALGLASWSLLSMCLWEERSSTAFAQDLESLQSQFQELEKRLKALEDRLQSMPQGAGPAKAQDAAVPKVFRLPEGFQKRAIRSTRDLAMSEGVANDSDFDGLTDNEETTLGTNPALPDTDGDALLDGWEAHGVNGIDLPALGASPLHKDIFVEMDYMVRASATNSLGPNAAVINGIRQAFAQAPVNNPDDVPGINIHLEVGNEVAYDPDLNPYQDEFFALKGVHFASARAPVYRYMIWANGYRGGSSSGVAMGIPHSDFLVTLGLWNGGAGGTDNEKIGTFIHELGHCLGLTHGGAGDHTHYKPNHISVMNYAFQTRGIKVYSARRFDYQRFPLPVLRENFLSEAAGLGGGSDLSGYWTIIQPNREVRADVAIDCNNNNLIDSGNVSRDLNGDNFLGDLAPTPDQWKVLVYNGGSIGSLETLENALETAEDAFEPFPYIELTEEMDRQFAP